jgi:hypothetical protein
VAVDLIVVHCTLVQHIRNLCARDTRILVNFAMGSVRISALDDRSVRAMTEYWQEIGKRCIAYHTEARWIRNPFLAFPLTVLRQLRKVLPGDRAMAPFMISPSAPEPISSAEKLSLYDLSLTSLFPSAGTMVSMTLEHFCDRLANSPLAHRSKIHKISLRKNTSGLHHEFLTMQIEIASRSMLWLRLDRSGDKTGKAPDRYTIRIPGFRASELPANDKISLADSEEELIRGVRDEKKVDVYFTGSETAAAAAATLHSLQVLLSIFIREAPTYTLLANNCYFLSNMVLGVLAETFRGRMDGSLPHPGLGSEMRRRIQVQFIRRMEGGGVGGLYI